MKQWSKEIEVHAPIEQVWSLKNHAASGCQLCRTCEERGRIRKQMIPIPQRDLYKAQVSFFFQQRESFRHWGSFFRDKIRRAFFKSDTCRNSLLSSPM